MRNKIIAILIALTLFPVHAAGAAENLDREIQAQQKARDDLTRKIQQYNELARKKAQESKTLLGQLSRLKQDAQESQARMAALERESGRLKSSMEELSRSIEGERAGLAALLPRFRERVVALYKYGGQPGGGGLLFASDAHDTLTTAYMLNCFIRQDQRLIEEMAGRVEALSRSRAQLEREGEQARAASEELRRKREEYGAAVGRTSALLKDIQGQRDKAQAAAKELTSAQQEVGARILSLTRRKQERSKAGAANAAGKTDTKAPAKAQTPTPATPAQPATGTMLDWPVRGTVTAPFGSRVHPVFKTKVFNSGIDIKAAAGTPVKAAGPGEVLFKGWIRGFGQVVIVDHGGDVSTVYAHLASASVTEGQKVKAGSVLGAVGNSGSETDYGLHFEVRRNGAAQNPMNYLKKA